MRRGLNAFFFTVPKCGFLPGNEKVLALLALVKPEVWTLKEKCILVSLGTGRRQARPGPTLLQRCKSFIQGPISDTGNFLCTLGLDNLCSHSARLLISQWCPCNQRQCCIPLHSVRTHLCTRYTVQVLCCWEWLKSLGPRDWLGSDPDSITYLTDHLK